MKYLVLVSVIMMSQLSFASSKPVIGVATSSCSKGYFSDTCKGRGFFMKQKFKKKSIQEATKLAEDECVSQGLYPDKVYKKDASCSEINTHMGYELFCTARVIMSCL